MPAPLYRSKVSLEGAAPGMDPTHDEVESMGVIPYGFHQDHREE
jgi:hypothetical protein